MKTLALVLGLVVSSVAFAQSEGVITSKTKWKSFKREIYNGVAVKTKRGIEFVGSPSALSPKHVANSFCIDKGYSEALSYKVTHVKYADVAGSTIEKTTFTGSEMVVVPFQAQEFIPKNRYKRAILMSQSDGRRGFPIEKINAMSIDRCIDHIIYLPKISEIKCASAPVVENN